MVPRHGERPPRSASANPHAVPLDAPPRAIHAVLASICGSCYSSSVQQSAHERFPVRPDPIQIVKVLKDGQCKINYDDGDKWTGDARYIMRLTGSVPTGPTVSTLVQAVPDGPVLVAAPSIPQATVVPAQAVAVDASVVAK